MPMLARSGYMDDHQSTNVCDPWWRHQMETFPRNRPFVRGIHRSPVNSPHKGQWREALMFSLICTRINDWVNTREAGDLRLDRAQYDINVMQKSKATIRFDRSYMQYGHWHDGEIYIKLNCYT